MPWAPGLEPWEDDPGDPLKPPSPTVWEDDNPVTGVLLGPDGETVLAVVTERPTVPFGFQPPPDDP